MVVRHSESSEQTLGLAGAEPALPGGHRVALGSLYAAHADRVRRHLSAFGVRPADLDDLSQEVFLVVTDKREGIAEIERVDLWLKEICRKVASGYRRRGFRLREVSAEGETQAVDHEAPLQSAVLESREDVARLRQAVHALDDEAKDLIAMHELGGLPLVDVALLVERDRKTVRKRLDEANRRLTRLFREGEPMRARGEAGYAPPDAARGQTRTLRLLGATPDITIGQIGAVLIAVWAGAPTLDALALLDERIQTATESCGAGLVYLALVESTTGTPSLPARKKISGMLKRHSTAVGVFPHVLLGGFSWIARPIMAGLAFLSGVPVPMPFFGSVERAADWLTTGYLRETEMERDEIVVAAEELRALAGHFSAGGLAPGAGVDGAGAV